jgi:hypothetical protein
VTLDSSPSPPLSSSHTFADADAAAQQLVAECRRPARNPPVSSAVLGASLLNAARIDHRHSSPPDVARRNGAGKLRRVTIVPEGPRQDLARRRNLYDIELSPEKGNYTLPEKVNHKPLKLAHKKKKQAEERSDVPGLSSEAPGTDVNDLLLGPENQEPADLNGHVGDLEPHPNDEPRLLSSPPGGAQARGGSIVVDDTNRGTGNAAHPATREDVLIQVTLPNGKPRCTAVPYKPDKRSGGRRYQQCLRPSHSRTDVGPRCSTHMAKPVTVQCEGVEVEDGTTTRCFRVATLETPHGARCGIHAASSGPPQEAHTDSLQETAKRKFGSDHNDERPSKLQRTQRQKANEAAQPTKALPQVRIPVQRSPEQQTDKEAAREVVDVRSQDDDLSQTTQAEELDSALAGKRTRSRKQAAEKDQPIQQQQQTKKSKGKKALKASKQAAADEAPVQALEAEEPYAEAQGPDTAQAEESDSAPADTRTRPRRQATDNDQSARQDQPSKQGRARTASRHPKQATAEEASVEEPEDEQSDAEAQERSAEEVEDSEGTVATPGTIEAVFDFLELDKRPGRCQTKLGIDIRRICKESSTQLEDEAGDEDEDESLATIMEDLQNLRSALNGIGSSVEEDDRRVFKGDAYAYIFRALTRYLQALYGWLEAKYAPVTQSLEAMRILSPLIHEILAFKSTIAKWDLSIPQRYKGDRIIKDVETGLIVHLRQVDKTFSVRLSRLEITERDRVQQERFMRQMEEKEEEARRRKEAADSRNKRRARWQDLHIARKLCEPPGDRRDKLIFTWPEDLEKDANGVSFERLAVFKARSIPPPHRASDLAEEREWTEDQESALLKGLEVFTGESHALLAYMRPTLMMNIGPRVFEQIFNEYCRPRPNDHARGRGGKLRDFSVTEITAKAAWYRSTLLKLYQDNNWTVADWITNIPVLP